MRNIFLSLLFGIVCNLFVIEAKNSLVSDFVVSRERKTQRIQFIDTRFAMKINLM